MKDKIDAARLEAELAADANVILSLRRNGDVASIVRPVDVRFVGGRSEIDRLAGAIHERGWRVVQIVGLDGDKCALDVQRDQGTEVDALRRLTVAALMIERHYDVRYDGWGTVARRSAD